MKVDEVPQDKSKTYGGHKKLLYAQDAKTGSYSSVNSSGWEIEETATMDAVEEFEQWAASAKQEVDKGNSSPLLFHMFDNRMDLPLLAQTSGFFQWQVKRHLKPNVFSRLSDKKLKRYADVLGISIETLKGIPK